VSMMQALAFSTTAAGMSLYSSAVTNSASACEAVFMRGFLHVMRQCRRPCLRP
jgi:hypothetical protein